MRKPYVVQLIIVRQNEETQNYFYEKNGQKHDLGGDFKIAQAKMKELFPRDDVRLA